MGRSGREGGRRAPPHHLLLFVEGAAGGRGRTPPHDNKRSHIKHTHIERRCRRLFSRMLQQGRGNEAGVLGRNKETYRRA